MAIKTDKVSDEELDLGDGQPDYNPPDLPEFGVGGNIFQVPGGLLDSVPAITGGNVLSGTPSGGFLAGSDVGFDVGTVGNNFGNVFTGGGSFLPGDLSLGGISGVNLGGGGGDVITLPPFVVTDSRLDGPPIITEATSVFNQPTSFVDQETGQTDEVVTLPPFVVTETRDVTTPLVTTTAVNVFTAPTGQTEDTSVVTLPPFVVTDIAITTTPLVLTTPPVTFEPPQTTPLVVTTSFTTVSTTAPTPSPTFQPTPQPTPEATLGGGGTASGTTTGTMSAQRDFDAELKATLESLRKYQPQIQQMYGDLYSQFMPKGITAAEPGVINQYQQDLARLQQRQAGVLSPEDVRQSQQAAREAYGARGQVMAPGAVGAEILNRESIRQQREEQARQALQQSYGNLMGVANLQTGNIFSPIAGLMGQTFNPLGAYPADVYGTNVNAQLARDIAQKNYEAAIKSAELTGSASRSAANTSLLGDLLKVGGTIKVAMACMPGDQAIDTPFGPVAVEDIKGGDEVVGYDGSTVKVVQVSSYVQDADRDFFTFHLSNGGKITVCDRHKILDIPASEWVVGSTMGDAVIERIDRKNGVTTSYDLVTEVGGYRIAGVPVNSMIPEMLAATLQLVALKHYA